MIDILPLGTVVKLKKEINSENESKFIIVGRFMIDQTTNEMAEYMGYVFPYGYQGQEAIVFFNSEHIEEVIFEGYLNEEEREFSNQIVKEVNKRRQL